MTQPMGYSPTTLWQQILAWCFFLARLPVVIFIIVLACFLGFAGVMTAYRIMEYAWHHWLSTSW